MTQLSPANAARAILLDATTLATTIDPALHNLDAGLAGWPTSCPGAAPAGSAAQSDGTCDELVHYTATGSLPPHRCGHPLPCPMHPTTSPSIVERTANTDTARRDLDQLRKHISEAAHHLQRAARISAAWGTTRLDKTTISNLVAELDARLWCECCTKYDQRNVKAAKGTLCEFCAGFRSRWKRLPTKRIFLCREGRGGKLYDNDVVRIFNEEKAERAALKAEQKREQRAAKAERKTS